MALFILLSIGLVILFGFVVFLGAPYLPSKSRAVETALDLLDLKPGQTLLELGSGDGRVLLAAAKRGVKTTGIELNPLLVIVAKMRTWRHRQTVRIIWGNYWTKKWPKADGAYVFLLDKYMKKLDKKIIQYKPIKLASFAFSIPGRKAVKKVNGVYLYNYE